MLYTHDWAKFVRHSPYFNSMIGHTTLISCVTEQSRVTSIARVISSTLFSSPSPESVTLQPTRRVWRLVLGYAASIIALSVVAVGDGQVQSKRPVASPRVLEPLVFPVLYCNTPPVLALYNELRGGSIGGSIRLGATLGLSFPILAGFAAIRRTGNGDTPSWALILTFLGIGVAGAALAIVLTRSGRLALERVQEALSISPCLDNFRAQTVVWSGRRYTRSVRATI